MATLHDVQFIRQQATNSQLLGILDQRDLALAVVAAAEKRRQLIGTPHEGSATNALLIALDAYWDHYTRTDERRVPVYSRETGEIT